MSPNNQSGSGFPKAFKTWADLIVPFLISGGTIGDVVYQALPLAPTLRPLGTFIAIAAALLAYFLSHRWNSETAKRPLRWRVAYSVGWFVVFLAMVALYHWLVWYLQITPLAPTIERLADVLQTSAYAGVFASLCVSLTLGIGAIMNTQE